MSRAVVATPLFARRLNDFLLEYAELGAVRFIERLEASYRAMLEIFGSYEEIAPVRRRTIKGKSVTVKEVRVGRWRAGLSGPLLGAGGAGRTSASAEHQDWQAESVQVERVKCQQILFAR